ncbi:hypothetical protein BHV42_03745 [Candidatus Melainabacteria bacterium MEL.A1]|nr:hypothetical protein BHV42_03745 [Candidatus Melainabacteria bacterium MEL.A1]
MGVSNVNNLNKIDLTKLALAQKSRLAKSNQPAYMQMTGSIFNAPEVKQQQETTNLNTLNTKKSLSELTKKTSTSNSTTNKTESKDKEENVDQGSVKSQGNQAKKGTTQTEKDSREVKTINSESKKLNKDIKQEDKKFQAQLKQQQAAFQKDSAKLEKLSQETEETQTEIDNAQNELDSLLGSSTFTISRGDGTQGGQSTNPNQDKIDQLQKFIGSKSNLVQNNGKQIYSLQRSSSRTLSRMNRTNANFVKIHKKNTKAIQQNQNETSNVVKFATKLEQWSAIAEQGGKALDFAGQGMVAAGQAIASTAWGAAVGAAMIATGTVMSKVGTVAEMLGQYGQTAANITKTAAYAAEGNLAGAMTSAAAAIQSGAAAQKSTKGLSNNFKAIDQRATDATNKAAANAAAKQAVKNMDAEQLGGMTKKEMKKSISGELQGQLANNEINSKDLFNDVKNKSIKSNDAVNGARDKAAAAFKENVYAAKGSLDVQNGVVTGLDKKARKEVGKKTVTGFTNTASVAKKSTQKFDFQKLSQGLMSTVALLSAQNTNTQGTHKGYAAQWDLNADPKMRRIRNARMASVRHAAYA